MRHTVQEMAALGQDAIRKIHLGAREMDYQRLSFKHFEAAVAARLKVISIYMFELANNYIDCCIDIITK